MKKAILSVAAFAAVATFRGQAVADFENLSLATDTFWEGADGSGQFSSGNCVFSNSYDTGFGYWTGGFAYSNTTDTVDGSFGNLHSSVTGGGYAGSANYAVGTFGSVARFDNSGPFQPSWGMMVTNSTFAARTIKNGDSFSKKFGGATGNDPDWFLLTITGFNSGSVSGNVNFFLADYRFSNNAQDYIVQDWEYVDLSVLGAVDSVGFALSSSDTGSFGMNTPAYFCVDNFNMTAPVSVAEQPGNTPWSVYPNPATDHVRFDLETAGRVSILDLTGRVVGSWHTQSGMNSISIGHYPAGVYHLLLETADSRSNSVLVIR